MPTHIIAIPADALGNSIDEGVVQDVVSSALGASPVVVRNHVHGKWNDLAYALEHSADLDPAAVYSAAIELAGIAMRLAWENRRGFAPVRFPVPR